MKFMTGWSLRLSASAMLALFSSFAAHAIIVTPGPADEVVWEQTRSFSMNQSDGVAIWWYEGQGLSGDVSSSYTGSVSFLASPDGFAIAGTRYALTTVTLDFSSTLTGQSKTYCHDTDIWSHCETFGRFVTLARASLETAPSTPLVHEFNSWDSAASADGVWCCIGIIPIGTAATTAALHSKTVYPSFVETYSGDELALFQQQRDVRLNLDKDTTFAMTGVQSNDTDAYVQWLSNSWNGNVSLKYTFTPTAVPEPTAANLLWLGLAGLWAARRRFRF